MSSSEIEKHHRGGGKMGPKCGDFHLQLDQACLQILGDDPNAEFGFQAQSSECYKCTFWNYGNDFKNGSCIGVNTTYATSWILSKNGVEICAENDYTFGQYGIYSLNTSSCQLGVDEEPSNPYLPILWAFLVLLGVQLLWIGAGKVLRKYPELRRMLKLNDYTNDLEERPTKKRVKSLDAFRGLAIVIMIFVNYGGGGYYFFAHSKWNGITVADLVFPWFMWIMGVSMAISIQSQLRNSVPRLKLVLSVFRRSLTLFFLGLVINSLGGHNDLSTFRIPGVLQRFALAYLMVGLLQATFAQDQLPSQNRQHQDNNTVPFWWEMRDVKACLFQWLIMLIIVSFHTCLTFGLNVPGCPRGYLGPGGLSQNSSFFNCTGGSAGYIDKVIFGRQHIYQHPTTVYVYDTREPFDPEGFLGSLMASFLVFLGVQCGYTLLCFEGWKARMKRWMIWALICGTLAGGLCGFSKENGLIPLNKNLWSLSFSLGLGAMAFALLSFMYFLIDVKNVWSGAPLFYAGMNPILLYMGHEICEEFFPFSWQPFTQTHAELLAMNLWGTSIWLFVAYHLFKRKLFFSV